MTHPVLDKLRSAIVGGRLIPPKCRVLVGLSGGADSVVLLHGLLALKDELDCSVFAAHLNHGIRGEAADADEAFCKTLCEQWGVPFFSKKVDCPALAREKKQTLEEAARFARYAFLEGVARETGAYRIAVAHHLDDQAETVLLNLLRGTGASGLRAMRPLRANIIRPLLFVSKAEILDYAAQNRLSYAQDETNADIAHSRNRLRALSKAFSRINAAYAQNVCRAAQLISEDDDALCAWAEQELVNALRGDGLCCEALNALPKAVSGRVLRLYAASRGLTSDLSLRHVDALRGLCNSSTGSSVNLPRGFAAKVEYGVLTIRRFEKARTLPDYCVPFDAGGKTNTPAGDIASRLIPRPKELDPASPLECFIAPDCVRSAVVRPRKPGDVIHPLGAPGKKKLKDYYIDKKIPQKDRCLPVLAIGNEVLWAVGAGISQRAAVREENTVLWLQFTPRNGA